MKRRSSLPLYLTTALALAFFALGALDACPKRDLAPNPSAPSLEDRQNSDAPIERAFAEGRSDVLVEGEGHVIKVLRDDLDGSRHQRFLLELASGHTLLVAHNIDLAPRVEGLREGDRVAFRGEYEWNEKGGVLHWTHHDPQGRHPGGWLEVRARRYE